MNKILFVFFWGASFSLHAQKIYYVKSDGIGNGENSWETATSNLQNAIDKASSNKGYVFIASGIYKPNKTSQGTSFILKSDCKIYGGFADDLSGVAQLADTLDRKKGKDDWAFENETILSGERGVEGTSSDNLENVIISDNILTSNTISNVILNGVTVADGGGDTKEPKSYGCGLYIKGKGRSVHIANIKVINCIKTGGATYGAGATLYSCKVDKSLFDGNINFGFRSEGGGAWLEDCQVSECCFSNNMCESLNTGSSLTRLMGAGAYVKKSDISKSIFSHNKTNVDGYNESQGVGAYIVSSKFIECEFSNNKIVQSKIVDGIGAYIEEGSKIKHCFFSNNSHVSDSNEVADCEGGGVCILNSTVDYCRFENNIVGAIKVYGAGGWFFRSSVTNSSFLSNSATSYMGRCIGGGGFFDQCEVHACDFIENIVNNLSPYFTYHGENACGGGGYFDVCNVSNSRFNFNQLSSLSSPSKGGGGFFSESDYTGNEFANNKLYSKLIKSCGGGAYVYKSVTDSSRYYSNTVQSDSAAAYGAGAYFDYADAAFSDFFGNSSTSYGTNSGGGAWFYSGDALNCSFNNNKVKSFQEDAYGAGVYMHNGFAISCLFSNNSLYAASESKGAAGAGGWYSSLSVYNCTFAKNIIHIGKGSGGGAHFENYTYSNSCSFWGNSILNDNSEGKQLALLTSSNLYNGAIQEIDSSYSVYGKLKTGCINLDKLNDAPNGPNFEQVSSLSGYQSEADKISEILANNFSHKSNSPLINKGKPLSLHVQDNYNVTYDLKGQNRVLEDTIDIGAFEVNADTDNDGIIDLDDLDDDGDGIEDAEDECSKNPFKIYRDFCGCTGKPDECYVCQDITINKGVNLLTLYIQDEYRADSVFDLTKGDYIKNNDSHYYPDRPSYLQFDSLIKPGEPLLVYSQNAYKISIYGKAIGIDHIQLKRGWNFFGYNFCANYSTLNLLNEESFIQIKDNDRFFDNTSNGTLNILEAGKSYFINVSKDCKIEFK